MKKQSRRKRIRLRRADIGQAFGLFTELHRMVIDALLYPHWDHKQWQLERILARLGFDPVEARKKYGYDEGADPHG